MGIRINNLFSLRMVRVLLFASGLSLLSFDLHAEFSVQLSEVTENFGKGSAFKNIRKYSFVIDGHKGYFIARKHKVWLLALVLSQASTLPIDVSGERLVGDGGVLFSCLDRFLKDVPDAAVERLDLEWRLDPILWTEYQKQARPFFENYGTISDVKTMEFELDSKLDALLSNSSAAKGLAKRLADRLGSTVKSIGSVPESWFFTTNPIGEKSSKFANLPNFGLSRPPLFHIYFTTPTKGPQ